jgi:hypothetical protein
MPAFKKPAYPETLLKAKWESKKSLAGKVQVKKTGIGDALAAAKTAFDKVNWTTLDLSASPFYNMNQYTPDGWDAALKAAKSELASTVVKVSAACDEIASLCDMAEKRFKEKKLKDDEALVKVIAKAASELGAATSRMVVNQQIEETYNDIVKRADITYDAALKGKASAFNKALGFIKEMMSDPIATKFNARQTDVRPVTQIIGTMQRFAKGGRDVGLSISELDKLWNDLSPYGNGKKPIDPNELPDKVMLEVQKLGRMLKSAAEKLK